MIIKKSKIRIFTIGAYGFNESSFLKALETESIDTFCDIRQRRGMRGSEYAWANSSRLQANLKNKRIDYLYLKSLAPTIDIREMQKAEDVKLGVNKRERKILGQIFSTLYKERCLVEENFTELFEKLPDKAKNVVFFCVEKSPQACHRSLLTDHLSSHFNVQNGGDIGHGNTDCF